jgi:penicillin-binding protein 1C
MIHLSNDKKYRVHADCESLSQMVDEPWFVLPPIEEYYYRSKNLSYKTLPSFKPGCQPPSLASNMDLIYPKEHSKVFIPRELNGSLGKIVVEVAHRNPQASVFWHLDDEYLGATMRTHRIPIQTDAGQHRLTLVDDSGEVLERVFEVASSR